MNKKDKRFQYIKCSNPRLENALWQFVRYGGCQKEIVEILEMLNGLNDDIENGRCKDNISESAHKIADFIKLIDWYKV